MYISVLHLMKDLLMTLSWNTLLKLKNKYKHYVQIMISEFSLAVYCTLYAPNQYYIKHT